VRLSFEIIPLEDSEKHQNGEGRSEPNLYPILPEPEGRLSFDFLHPLNFLKELIGEDAYDRLCMTIVCFFALAVLFGLGYFVFGATIANLITK
jgi:hypothetical protein